MEDQTRAEPLRIAAHNGAPVWGGAEIAVSRLLAGLKGRGHDVRFFAARDEVLRPAGEFGLTMERLHVGGDIAVHHTFRVAAALRRHRSQVLIIGTFRKLLHLACGARLAGVPVVARVGLEGDTPRSAKYRFLFRHWVDRVVVLSRTMQEAYLDAMPELGGRVVRIPKGVEAPRAGEERAAVRNRLGLPQEVVVVSALARLVPDKRIDRFVDVITALPSSAVGLVAGDGPLRSELEAHARERGSRVHFLGHIDWVGDLLRASDVVLITSRREGMANAMIEAMAAGVPVVSTPVDGAEEALSGGDEGTPPGIVTSSFEVPEIVDAVIPLVANADLRRRAGAAAVLRARSRFGEEAMLDGWERLLRQLANRGTPVPT